jgi:hypothetical protein
MDEIWENLWEFFSNKVTIFLLVILLGIIDSHTLGLLYKWGFSSGAMLGSIIVMDVIFIIGVVSFSYLDEKRRIRILKYWKSQKQPMSDITCTSCGKDFQIPEQNEKTDLDIAQIVSKNID